MAFTNDEFKQLVTKFLQELRPLQPVKVGLAKFTKPGSDVAREYMFIRLNVERGPTTDVRFTKSSIVGMGSAQIKVFLTDKLAAIGVEVEKVRAVENNVVGETQEEFDGSITPAEEQTMRDMLGTANIHAPGQAEAQAKVEQQLKVDEANVTLEDLENLSKVLD